MEIKVRRDLSREPPFGRLTAIRPVSRTAGGITVWLCRCECGNEIPVGSGHLTSGHTKSCGCAKTKHGMSRTQMYMAWHAMIERCNNPKCKAYPDYGGRGIRVCERWMSFENFLADMGERPDGMTIDRKDVDGNYEPDNCRWATRPEQNDNRRNTRRLTHEGRTQTYSEWASETGIGLEVIAGRVERGWDSRRVLFTPVRKQKARAS